MTHIEKRQGADQELAAVELTADMVTRMVSHLLESQRQWDPELVETFLGAFQSGDASLRVVFDISAGGMISLKIFGKQDSKLKTIFDITPKYASPSGEDAVH